MLDSAVPCIASNDSVVNGKTDIPSCAIISRTRRWNGSSVKSSWVESANATENHGTWAVAVRLLDACSSGAAFTGSLGSQSLAGDFATRAFSGGLLGACHARILRV
jgi:hypothetical protein